MTERNRSELEADIQPIGDRVFCITVENKEDIVDGIVIPETSRENSQEAVVVSVGPGTMISDGRVIPLSVKPGMKVVLPKHGGTVVELNKVKYQIVHENQIIAVIGIVAKEA